MKQLIVYAGANGAGKSSLRAGGADPVDVEIDPDRIARQMNPTDPRSVDFAAGKEALRLFDRTLAEGRSLSLETTLTGRTVLGRMQAAKDSGYDVTLRYVAVNDIATNIRRVEGRAARGGHWIEPETIRRRVAGSLGNLPAAIVIADRAVLLDNSGSSHRQVLELERGRVLFEAPDPPRWLAGQMPRIAAELERVTGQSRLAPFLSPDGRLVQAAFNEKVEREMGHLDAAGRARVKTDFARALNEKEQQEGPVVLSAELRRLATAPEPSPVKSERPEPPRFEPDKPSKRRR